GLSTNPDGLAAQWSTLESGRVAFIVRNGVRRAIEGRPDWILEVLSDSSVKKDTETLRESYHRIEIPEYWLIDARGKEILFQILNWKHHGYVAAPSKSGWS